MALAPLERNLLGLLTVAGGAVLSTERIVDGLWGARPPAAARSRVQGLVSSLRRKIGEALVTRTPGYCLDVPAGASDLDRCRDLAERAASADTPADAARRLREALGLWRGEPLDGCWAPGLDADRMRLTELRTTLLEERFDAELRLGRHAELIGELKGAVAADPLRERLTGQLMTALYRANRQAEALRAYQALRERLADELGSDPCADVRDLHAAILRGEADRPAATPRPRPAEPVPPAQIPAGVGHFVGREADLVALTAMLPGTGDEPRVVLVTGAGGLGKTALTVAWAHTVAQRFPDGQILVDLRGSGPGTLSAGAALGVVLLALGVPADRLPDGTDERAALYRTRMHGRRVLLVADDAGAVGHLLPLVPPTPGSVVVATSRRRLSALSAHHATRVLDLAPLDRAPAHELLCRIAGPDRLTGDGVAEILDECAGWPLALRLAGATLAARSAQSPASFAEELRERVGTLSVGDDPRTVHRALAQAQTGVDPAAVRLFDQLGLLPGRSLPLHLAAAAAGTSVLRARRLLDELIGANLVLSTGPDRYGFHATIRRYAARRGAALTDRVVVEERVARWYLATFDHLARRFHPGRQWPPVAGPAEWLPFRSDLGAIRFAAAESPEVPAVLRWMARRGDAWLTFHFASIAGAACPRVPAEVAELGLAAAAELGDQRALGEAQAQLGAVLLRDPLRFDEAGGHLTLATELLEGDDGRAACVAAFGLGALLARQGRPAEARPMLERALGLLDPSSEPLACAVALAGYATTLVQEGSDEAGFERYAQALILTEATVGRRNGGAWLSPRRRLGEDLAYLEAAVDSPRATLPDRSLARLLLDLNAGSAAHRLQLAVG